MAKKATQGPWQWVEVTGRQGRPVLLGAESNRRILTLSSRTVSPSAADGRLIAAAPELFDALERLMDESCPFLCDTESCECGEYGTGLDEFGNICEHIQARRALAKVEGDAP
jgi:hypothetical protein